MQILTRVHPFKQNERETDGLTDRLHSDKSPQGVMEKTGDTGSWAERQFDGIFFFFKSSLFYL